MPTLGVRSPLLRIYRCKIPPTPPTFQSTYVSLTREISYCVWSALISKNFPHRKRRDITLIYSLRVVY
jgi:hypothetical protein